MPAIWLFTDPRMGVLRDALRRLPMGRAGVVYRLEGQSPAEARRIFALCRARRLALSLAVPAPVLPPRGAGWHLRRGRGRAGCRAAFLTSSAHDAAEIGRAYRRGAALIFVSPVFPTRSHAGAGVLGARGFVGLTQGRRGGFAALGGMNRCRLRALGGRCRAFGAIDGLSGGT